MRKTHDINVRSSFAFVLLCVIFFNAATNVKPDTSHIISR